MSINMIKVKRAYDKPEAGEGARFLVDRLWPRGIKRDALHLTDWLKEAAPSDSLRKWFGHDPQRWEEFRRRYFAELDARPHAWRPLVDAATTGEITLPYRSPGRATQHRHPFPRLPARAAGTSAGLSMHTMSLTARCARHTASDLRHADR